MFIREEEVNILYDILLKELPDKVCGIYKITFPNGKVYIGQSNNIRRRMYEHNNINKNKHLSYCPVCDKAIIKYGKIHKITILEECSESELDHKEQYWITYFSSNQKDTGYNIESGGKRDGHNSNRCLTDDEVLNIRRQRKNGKRKKDVFKQYKNQISFDGFEKIWLGVSCPQIGKELLESFVGKTRQQYSQEANTGSRNGQAKLSKEQVLKIRELFEHRDKEQTDRQNIIYIANLYNMSITSIYNIVHYKSYKDVKPVSTIPYVETQGSSTTIDT